MAISSSRNSRESCEPLIFGLTQGYLSRIVSIGRMCDRIPGSASILLAFFFSGGGFGANSFRMRTYRQTPRFAGFWLKLSARNSFVFRIYAQPHA